MELMRWLAKLFRRWRPQMFTKTIEIKSSSSVGVTATAMLTLDSATKYYSEILKPAHDEFFANPATLRSAFILASALFHFHEWLFEYHKTALEGHLGATLGSKGALWSEVEKVDNRFAFIRDLANASKHVRLTKRPSTSMSHIANTTITVASTVIDQSSVSTASVKMKDGANDIEFDDCARALFGYWTTLSGRIGVIA
jgi:hypothetical protein